MDFERLQMVNDGQIGRAIHQFAEATYAFGDDWIEKFLAGRPDPRFQETLGMLRQTADSWLPGGGRVVAAAAARFFADRLDRRAFVAAMKGVCCYHVSSVSREAAVDRSWWAIIQTAPLEERAVERTLKNCLNCLTGPGSTPTAAWGVTA